MRHVQADAGLQSDECTLPITQSQSIRIATREERRYAARP
jgi:hypothetical protein